MIRGKLELDTQNMILQMNSGSIILQQIIGHGKRIFPDYGKKAQKALVWAVRDIWVSVKVGIH
jgi:hypothetical protein